MSTPRRKPEWELPESALTDEQAYLNRRRFIQALGLGGLSAASLAFGGRGLFETAFAGEPIPPMPKLAAKKNPAYTVTERKLSAENGALRYNNFYEFTTDKTKVWRAAKDFVLDPYSLEVGGLVNKPGKLSLEQVEALGLEERIYRFRCVEAWSMTVPWIGVPLRKLLEHVGVQPKAKYLSFVSFHDPKQAPGQTRASGYTWPYYEALRLDEAMNELPLLVTGIYGRRIPPQNGAPLRLIVPWKYGYKSPKSVVKIMLTETRPPTFWHDAVSEEYSWLSNVEPTVPHPRWSQASEKHITKAGGMGPTFKRLDTLPYNGYANQVAKLYPPKKR
ncbi:MAG: protein-methionine-sulfoxide reductase catalytic subunit MsrP [Planctomycetes bacterium]|nr:protein-methionine-sulfoxide reductase catalytic subunit MsrP [Planctomycetota bacterium]